MSRVFERIAKIFLIAPRNNLKNLGTGVTDTNYTNRIAHTFIIFAFLKGNI